METPVIVKNTNAIEVNNFSKKYRGNKNYSVKDMSFVVKRGEFHGFIGANGAGKTTIIKSIIGAYARYEGNVKILGLPNTERSAKEKIGYIPEIALFPSSFSIHSYLKNMAILSGMKRKKAPVFATEKLKELGLGSVAKRNPNNLSSGQKKKVLLAQALLHNPEIIIMDEPAANLDPKARMEFFQYLLKIKKENDVTIFISSHILDELEKYVDSITIIDNGKKSFSGNMKDALKAEGKDKKNDKPNWKITTSDSDKTQTIFKKLKVDYSYNANKFIISATSKEFMKISTKLVDQDIEIIKSSKIGSDLGSIYEKYTTVGSMDTTIKGGEE